MNKVIILEGVDGSGKTTFAYRLHDQYGFKVLHHGVPEPDEYLFKTYAKSLWDALHDTQPVVFDRHYLGETIYGPVMRDRSRLSGLEKLLLERLCLIAGVQVVICNPGRQLAYDAWREKKDDYLTKTFRWDRVYNLYKEVYSEDHALYHHLYDWETWLDSETEDLINLAGFASEGTDGFLGNRHAKYLIVGEQVNFNPLCERGEDGHYDLVDLPFFNTSLCSQYLHESLAQVPGLDLLVDLLFVNSLDTDGKPQQIAEFLEYVQQERGEEKKVIALGKVASEELAKQGIEHAKVHHPAYFRRFHTHDQDLYVNLLREAMEK